MTTHDLRVPLTVRDLDPEDLPGLDWTGGAEHLRVLAGLVGRTAAGEAAARVVALPSGRLVAMGAVDFTVDPDAGLLTLLTVAESWQSLGVGTLLVSALEDAVRQRGRREARIAVEHDNPRAAALYRRLGYRPYGTGLDSWPVAGGRTYVTAVAVLRRLLDGGGPAT